jgi:Ca-activated chloride channel family protein
MRIRTFAALASLSMSLSAAGAWALSSPAAPAPLTARTADSADVPAPPKVDASRFVDGKTLLIEGRLGRASVPRTQGASSSTESFILATVTGGEPPPGVHQEKPPVHLAIVVDRSGSMAGAKMRNAVLAAVEAVERMADGDRVTVVAFDSSARVVSAPTVLSASSRPRVEAAIRAMQPGGDTCISCALEMASTELEGAAPSFDEVRRVLLISDGEATTGVRDVPGLRALASRVSARGFSVSTIGVDLTFDEKVMAAIAQESNGKHWFLPDPSALATVFQEELGALQTAVATGAELSVEPAPGVEIEDVLDRPFRREGGRVVVALGTFDPKQEKTVLVRARVPSDGDGTEPVVRLSLAYRDVSQRLDARCGGALAVDVRSDGSAEQDLDPFVAARVQRSLTARTLTEANDLFERGKAEEARKTIARRRDELERTAAPLMAAKGAGGGGHAQGGIGRSLDTDFGQQQSALAEAQQGFAAAPAGAPAATAAAPPAAKAVRNNQANAVDLAF